MIGYNVIGRVYRPKKVNNIENGFVCKTIYKSNYGAVKDLELYIILKDKELYIDTNNTKTRFNGEVLKHSTNMDVKNVDILIKPDYYMSQKTNKKIRKGANDGIIIPIMYSKNNTLYCNELLVCVLIVDNEEYISMELLDRKPILL